MDQLSLKSKIFHGIHLFGLVGVAVGLPFNKIVLSIALMLLIANLLVQAKFKTYWENLKGNRLFILISAYFFLHFIGLLWTQELDFALRDIRVKIPLLILPLVLGAKPISKKERNALLLVFVGSVLLTSVINFLSYHQVFGPRVYTDIRGMSLFGSHIRYGIMVGFAAAICLYFLVFTRKYTPVLIGLIGWFAVYTYYSEILSGAIAYVIGVACILFPILYSKKKLMAYALLFLILSIGIGSAVVLLSKPTTEQFDIAKAPHTTAEGNLYAHHLNESRDVYGNYLFTYYCDKELRREWEKVSSVPYDSLDARNQKVRFTLLRYLASKKLTKDAQGFKQLKTADIKNVEMGITEDPAVFKGIWNRMNGLRYQIHFANDPNGHSLLQRFEFWKAGCNIIKKNWLFGVGTGDNQIAFDKEYIAMNSKLDLEHRFRAHNTYLTVWISFGVFALLFFYMLFAFTKEVLAKKEFLAFAFILISIATFLIEDTLETQAGVTFFAFFYALFSAKKD